VKARQCGKPRSKKRASKGNGPAREKRAGPEALL
jgi:hypothetical protein